MTDSDGNSTPIQSRVLDQWPDGSIRWVLLDFRADVARAGAPQFLASFDGDQQSIGPATQVRLTESTDRIVVDTGVAQFMIVRHGVFPFAEVRYRNAVAIDPLVSPLRVLDAGGRAGRARIDRVTVEERGPLRATVLIEGAIFGGRRAKLLDLLTRIHFFAGLPTVRFELTVRNPRKAGHRGGRWALGSRGSIYLKDLSMRFSLPPDCAPLSVCCSKARGMPLQPFDGYVELYQDSSGGTHWNSPVHVNRNGVVPHQFRGYRFRTPSSEQRGLRATPIVRAAANGRALAITMPHFWENFPKAIEAAGAVVTLRLFPGQSSDLHEIQGGEQKTHTFAVTFGDDQVCEQLPLDWCRAPSLARAEPAWYCPTGAVPYLVPLEADPNRDFVRLVNAAIDSENSLPFKRERIDEYGWRHFGELYADHEAAFQPTDRLFVSHYNNQYDAVAGFAQQFLRSGDSRWWNLLTELADHVIDIDIYHTTRDKAAYNGGLFWHTIHYRDADTSTHRSYPRAAKPLGGGPSAEHNYTTGLMLHHFLTGSARSREAAIGLARWVIQMDQGRQTIFRWLAGADTGLASATTDPAYHGPGRGAAYSINALLDGYVLTGERAYLRKAESLIRRVVHPADDVEARALLDAERRWSYTVFLQVLGKYLDAKADRGELDEMYTYARESLLTYARWMCSREYPYLDKPERLEYPTETWAAQDLRKTDVFYLAAQHSSGEERIRFLERGRFFFRSSVDTLATMPTRTGTRPLVLMLSNGWLDGCFQRHPDAAAEPGRTSMVAFGRPQSFFPQKAVATRRARQGGVAAAAGILAAIAWWVGRVMSN